MPRKELKNLLELAWPKRTVGDSSDEMDSNELGIGLDCCVRRTKISGIYLIQTTDFFFPLVEDPHLMGRIACANVLSDLFAMGITRCDNMLMLLGASTDMTENERGVILPMIMRGFNEAAKEIETSVQGGQTVRNPWLLIGGVATAVVQESEILSIDLAEVGDVLVLTKPLGTRIIGNAFQWYDQKMARFDNIKNLISIDNLIDVYLKTGHQMAFLNLEASKTMKMHGVKACTDITGFGILGHAQNLAEFQKNEISFSFHTLPFINYSLEISKNCGLDFSLIEGLCPETSGGLLICLPKENATAFCNEMKSFDGSDRAWIVGNVVSGDRTAVIQKDVKLISVPPVYR